MNIRTKISAASMAAAFALILASGADAATHHMKSAHQTITAMGRTTATLNDGTKRGVESDPLRQQIFRVM